MHKKNAILKHARKNPQNINECIRYIEQLLDDELEQDGTDQKRLSEIVEEYSSLTDLYKELNGN